MEPERKGKTAVYDPGNASGTRIAAADKDGDEHEAMRPPPLPDDLYITHEFTPSSTGSPREWIAHHLKDLAFKIKSDFEIIAFEAKWDLYNQKFVLTLHRKKD